jgi:cell division protein FtsL
MNAAARFLNHGVLSRGWAISIFLSRAQISTLVLIIGVLTSALSIVYVTNNSRSLNANLQQTFVERDHYHVQWGQLLLERSTWVLQSRVQQIAEEQLDMQTPTTSSIKIIKAQL